MQSETSSNQARALWETYYMLTEELLKYINAQDVEQFLELVRQRDVCVERMKELEHDDFRGTAPCLEMIEKLKPMEMQISYKAKSWLNKSRRQNSAVKGYGNGIFNPLGNILNRKY